MVSIYQIAMYFYYREQTYLERVCRAWEEEHRMMMERTSLPTRRYFKTLWDSRRKFPSSDSK